MHDTQAQTDWKQSNFEFQDLGRRKVVADFSGEHLSSDGGCLLLREVDRHLGLTDKLAGCFADWRNPHLGILPGYWLQSINLLQCNELFLQGGLMASETVSIRVPRETKHWLERFSRSRGSISAAASRLIEEAKRREQLRFVDFRDTHFGRIAYIQGTRIPVYLASMTADDLNGDASKLAEHYSWPLAKAETVLTYSAAFPDEIAQNVDDHRELDDFDSLKRMIPTLQSSKLEG